MFKQIFNRPNRFVLFKFSNEIPKNHFLINSSIRYLSKNNINKNIIDSQSLFSFSKSQMSDDVFSQQKQHSIEEIRFQNTSAHQQQRQQSIKTNSLEMLIDQNKETLLKGQR